MQKKLSLVVALLLAVLPSCSRQSGSPRILDHERFVQVYVAALNFATNRAGTVQENPSKANMSEVYLRFGTNEREFWATVDAYGSEPEKWSKFFQEVNERLQKQAMDELTRKPGSGNH